MEIKRFLKLKTLYLVLSIFSALFGAALVTENKMHIVGAVTGSGNITANATMGFGIFFLVCGLALLGLQLINKG